MSISIEYISNITNNNNIFIFVSSLSQLKSIDFLANFNLNLSNKYFINQIIEKKSFFFSNIQNNDQDFNDITIFLVDHESQNLLKLGSSISSQMPVLGHKKNIFVFPKNLYFTSKDVISEIILGFGIKSYIFDKYKSKKNLLNKIYLYKIKEFKILKNKLNLLKSINFSKNLVSEPSNILNPINYANKCKELKKIGLKVKVLDKKDLEKIGMRGLLGVSQGSSNDPRVLIFELNVKKNIKPTILVGKGVTFDSGGISLKPSDGMEEMIFDMAGSAIVVGSMLNAALNKSKKSLVGIIGLVENMPDGNAQRPGDIIKSLSGKTIEILNTDAEGRLVLADILTYVQSIYRPKQIIDFATLTGAIIIALGTHRAGLFSNNNTLANKLYNAGESSGEKIWRMPLSNEYDSEMNSRRADVKNIGSSRYGGSIQAAQFIQRFIDKDTPWAHIDIAGVSWANKPDIKSFSGIHSSGATAFGVRLIDHFLKGK